MERARYVVDAVILEGRTRREVAKAHGVSKSWVAEQVRRYLTGGYAAIGARSRRPHASPTRTPPGVEDQIVRLRKQLADDGLDAGPQTIHYHLSLVGGPVPHVATIWRILKRRGFITPQPQKRPRSSWIRFEASLPNECWQSDVTHWKLNDGAEVEIVNFLDDYSRLVCASRVFAVVTAPDVVAVFRDAAKQWGFPASVLSDNGAVYTAAYRNGRSAMETELLSLGIAYKHSRPYHPQTCGKVERFHQTLKAFLAKQPPAETIADLQSQIDRFTTYYNTVRPHRSKNRATPKAAFDARDKATPTGNKVAITTETRVRHDKVDRTGVITLRHRSRLHHIGIGRALNGVRVIVLVSGLDIRILSEDGAMIRQLTLDPSKDYQPTGKPRYPNRVATMSGDICP